MSECYCDFDQPAFYHAHRRKSRKERKCDECFRVIKIGEAYESVFAKWDDVTTFFTCSTCLSLRDYVVAHVPCSCWSHGSMIDDVMNDAEEYAGEAPGLLFGALRRKILIRKAKP